MSMGLMLQRKNAHKNHRYFWASESVQGKAVAYIPCALVDTVIS